MICAQCMLLRTQHIQDRYTDSVLNGLRGSYNRINHAYYNHPLPLPVIGKYLDLSPYVEI